MTDISPELEIRIIEDVRNALAEDIGEGDLTAALVQENQQAAAKLTLRDDAVICGIPWFNEVFRRLASNIAIEWHVSDGDMARSGTVICELSGPARALLTGERTAMNFLQTLSGTATAARAFCMAVENTGATILDTRKTIPSLRLAQNTQYGAVAPATIGPACMTAY